LLFGLPREWCDESITDSGQGLDEAGILRGIPEEIPQRVHRRIQTVLKTYVGVWPETFFQGLASDNIPGSFEKKLQNLKWFFRKAHAHSVLSQFMRFEIDLEASKFHGVR
jgi:hypothetical protein